MDSFFCYDSLVYCLPSPLCIFNRSNWWWCYCSYHFRYLLFGCLKPNIIYRCSRNQLLVSSRFFRIHGLQICYKWHENWKYCIRFHSIGCNWLSNNNKSPKPEAQAEISINIINETTYSPLINNKRKKTECHNIMLIRYKDYINRYIRVLRNRFDSILNGVK